MSRQKNIVQLMAVLSTMKSGYTRFRNFLAEYEGDAYSKLWQFLSKSKRYTDNTKDRGQAFKAVFGKLDYDARKIRLLINKLCIKLDMFIMFDKSQTNPLGLKLRGEIYNDINELDAALNTNCDSESRQHYINFTGALTKYLKSEDGPNVSQLDRSESELRNFFMVNQLKIAIEKLTIMKMRGEKDKAYPKDVSRFLQMLPEEQSPLIKVQAAAVGYFLEPSKERFYCFKAAFMNNKNSLSDKKHLFGALLNAIAVFPKPDVLRPEYFPLYQYGVKNDLFTENGFLKASIFNNILFVATMESEYDFLESFIATHSQLIRDAKEQKRCLLLAEAYASFGKGNYDEVLEKLDLLEKAGHLSPTFVLRKHRLKYKTIFESTEDKYVAYNFFDAKGRAFKKRLKEYQEQKYITETTRESYLNFFSLLSKIARQEKSKKELETILNSFGGKVIEIKWLRKKIAELS